MFGCRPAATGRCEPAIREPSQDRGDSLFVALDSGDLDLRVAVTPSAESRSARQAASSGSSREAKDRHRARSPRTGERAPAPSIRSVRRRSDQMSGQFAVGKDRFIGQIEDAVEPGIAGTEAASRSRSRSAAARPRVLPRRAPCEDQVKRASARSTDAEPFEAFGPDRSVQWRRSPAGCCRRPQRNRCTVEHRRCRGPPAPSEIRNARRGQR